MVDIYDEDIYNPSLKPLADIIEEDNNTDTIVYTTFGEHDTILNGYPILLDNDVLAETRSNAYAKKINRGDASTYYVKIGGVSGRLQDPISVFGKTFRPRHGNTFRFRKVSEVVFNFYIKYLRYKNPAYLRNAEREALNG